MAIKVAALTSGHAVPSSRFRVQQFIRPLAEHGVLVRAHTPAFSKYTPSPIPALGPLWTAGKLAARLPGLAASHFSDIVWFERELVPGKETLERFAGARRLLDVDDALWMLNDSKFSERIAARCDGVIAGNEFLASHYRAYGTRAWVVPTSVDTVRWQPATRPPSDEWVIGWTGTRSNLSSLQTIEEPLAAFLSDHSAARLLVVCDERPMLSRIPAERIRYMPWSEQEEVALVQAMDVGVMPLVDTPWSRGKCAFKMLLYMAVGLPVIVSPIGANQDVLKHGQVGLSANEAIDWYDALRTLYQNRSLTSRMGALGRQVVCQHYSVEQNALRLADIFREVACG